MLTIFIYVSYVSAAACFSPYPEGRGMQGERWSPSWQGGDGGGRKKERLNRIQKTFWFFLQKERLNKVQKERL